MVLSQMAMDKTTNNHVRTIANNVINRRKRDIDVIEKMLNDANQETKAPITKTNIFNYMNIGRQDKKEEEKEEPKKTL